MTTYRISNGTPVEVIRGPHKGLRFTVSVVENGLYFTEVDDEVVGFDGGDLLEAEPRWLDFARNAFWFVCGFVAGAVAVHQGWLP